MALDPGLLEILACPEDKTPVRPATSSFSSFSTRPRSGSPSSRSTGGSSCSAPFAEPPACGTWLGLDATLVRDILGAPYFERRMSVMCVATDLKTSSRDSASAAK